jgi:DNA-binding transcriptional regulator YhcF (GntR family)
MPNHQTPSQLLETWLMDQAKTPGARLPTDARLAETFGCSVRTVARVMEKLRSRNSFVRIPGKGTFVSSGDPEPPSPAIAPSRTSVDSLVDYLMEKIRTGEMIRGDSLPQVKYLARQMKTGYTTVVKAYRLLREMKQAVKIGKTFWVGETSEDGMPAAKGEVFLFKHHSDDFADIFESDMLAASFMKMEREFSAAGRLLRFQNTDRLNAVSRQWFASGKPPIGIIFFRTRQEDYRELSDRILQLIKRSHHEFQTPLRVLLDCELGSIFDTIPRSMHVLGRGHISTATARSVARYIIASGHRQVALFTSDSSWVWRIPPEAACMKIWIETRILKPAVHFDLMVKSESREPGAGRRFLGQMGNMRTQVAKYPGVSIDGLRDFVSDTASFERCFRRYAGNSLWIFTHASGAATALDWCAKHGVDVPGKISVLSLENHSDCYRLGISSCDPDWERIGYVLAHAILGTFPIEKTRKGFIRTFARLIHRSTTRG